jgi:hypothetical protein
MPAFEPGIPYGETQYTVSVDFTQVSNRNIQPICGVNKGVLDFGRYSMDYEMAHAGHEGYVHDYSYLYAKAGIHSVRTHDDVFDVANIFRGTSDELPSEEILSGVNFIDEIQSLQHSANQDERILFRELRRIANGHLQPNGLVFAFEACRDEMNALSGYYRQLLDLYYPVEFTSRDFWLSWRPLHATAVLDPDCYRYDLSHVEQAWSALVRAHHKYGIDVFFRIGESWRGPTYPMMPGQLEDRIRGGRGKEYYAQAAAAILEELSAMEVAATHDEALLFPDSVARRGREFYYPSVSPQLIEIWNEPNSDFCNRSRRYLLTGGVDPAYRRV